MLKCFVSGVFLRRVAVAMSFLLGLALIQAEVLAATGRHALLVGITRYPPSASAIEFKKNNPCRVGWQGFSFSPGENFYGRFTRPPFIFHMKYFSKANFAK